MKKHTIELLELRDTLNAPSSRAVIARLLDDLGYWSDTFNQDSHQHAYCAGARSAAVKLVQQIEANFPELWFTLQRERIDKLYNTQRNKGDDDDDGNE